MGEHPGPGGDVAVAEVDVDDVVRWIREFARIVTENTALLTELDAAIGDADHGLNMERGLRAVIAAVEGSDPPSVALLLKQVGLTLVSTVGGASGPLYGTLFLRMAGAVGDGRSTDAGQLATGLRAGLAGVVARGKAEPGDKTMFDALAPACDAFEDALAQGVSIGTAFRAASAAAARGRDATTDMAARKGRASYLGDRSIGHQDPGATSAAMLVAAAAEVLR